MKKTGLGRGLSALMGDEGELMLETDIDREYIHQLPISSIDTNRAQPRKTFDENSIRELASSIAANGLLQPITVHQKGERYEIVAGERRFRACRLLNMKTIPAIVKELSPRQVCELALIENLQREDLNPIEGASAIAALMDEYQLTQQEISQRLGISRPAIANAVRLLKLPEKVRLLISEGKLSAGHGRTFAALEDDSLIVSLAQKAVEEDWSVRETEKHVAAIGKDKPVKPQKTPSIELKEAEDTFREALGTRVTINGTEKRGKVEIEYFSRDDLERLLELITKK